MMKREIKGSVGRTVINDLLKGQNIIWFIKKTKIKLVRPC
jgi:hypothetical protein